MVSWLGAPPVGGEPCGSRQTTTSRVVAGHDRACSTIATMETASLGPLEQRVMVHLWHVGPATVGEVRDALNAGAKRQLAYTTVMTILVRLDEKGYVSRTREGRLFRYTAAFAEDDLGAQIGRRDLRRLIERHGADTLAGFAADLVGPESDLAVGLQRIADESPDV